MTRPIARCTRCLRILKHEATVEWFLSKPYHWRCLERELREPPQERRANG